MNVWGGNMRGLRINERGLVSRGTLVLQRHFTHLLGKGGGGKTPTKIFLNPLPNLNQASIKRVVVI
jgi:hypothetical protein